MEAPPKDRGPFHDPYARRDDANPINHTTKIYQAAKKPVIRPEQAMLIKKYPHAFTDDAIDFIVQNCNDIEVHIQKRLQQAGLL